MGFLLVKWVFSHLFYI